MAPADHLETLASEVTYLNLSPKAGLAQGRPVGLADLLSWTSLTT